jgi:acetylornithine deacetylase/succinyl-diaminopimelate desuccinylase-like protein
MPIDHDAAPRVLAQIDRDELAELGRAITDIPSPTGKEQALAEFIMDWFAANGMKPVRREVEVGRPNAVGILKGAGGGLSLMFNGHMDTSYTGTEEDRMITANLEPESELHGSIVDGKVRGLGISNMKGGVSAFMMAGAAIQRSGLRLKGDLILAAVVGEISRTPIGPYQTKEYRGEGTGTRHLLTHGVQSDYAVVADGSDLNIVWTQNGVVDVKITTFGQAESAWGTRRSTHPPMERNAIVKMTRIIEALERWGKRFEDDYIYESPTGPLYPKVNIGAIEGGAPFRPNYFPGVCSVYVDVRFPPQVRPVLVQREIEQALAPLEIEYELEVYKSLLGHEGKGVEPLVESLEEIHQHLFGEKLQFEKPERASIWTDTNVYNELGIPAVKIGPRGKRIGPRAEELAVDEMVKAAQIYALVALDICNRERP